MAQKQWSLDISERYACVGGEGLSQDKENKTEMANKYIMETEPVKYVEVTENLENESTHTILPTYL